MKVRASLVLLGFLLLTGLLVGCAGKTDYTARFLRYTNLQDGTRVAVVTPVEHDEAQTAYTDMTDLKPNELVYIRWVGRSWETPQWMPEREIASRASKP